MPSANHFTVFATLNQMFIILVKKKLHESADDVHLLHFILKNNIFNGNKMELLF